LFDVVDFVDGDEVECDFLDAGVVRAFFDLCILVEVNAVVVVNAGELLVCDFDLPIGEDVHFVLLQLIIELHCLLVEEGGLDLPAKVVHQLNVQDVALTPGISPLLQRKLLCDPSLNCPVELERVQCLDRRIRSR